MCPMAVGKAKLNNHWKSFCGEESKPFVEIRDTEEASSKIRNLYFIDLMGTDRELRLVG